MKTLIVIPARYGSTRLPGKPMADIAGVGLLERVVRIAQIACRDGDCDYLVATDHQEILNHAQKLGAPVVMTGTEIPSGSDRCLAAVEAAGADPEFVINLQGDVPFTPPDYLTRLVTAATDTQADIVTLGLQLNWDALDELRRQKTTAPFSGTTCIRTENGNALWFSKNILPAIRKETELREKTNLSPVVRHVGIYGYRIAALKRYVTLPPSPYEVLEGLEQLRALEAGMSINVTLVQAPKISMSGIDTAEDVSRAEGLITQFGDPHHSGEYVPKS